MTMDLGLVLSYRLVLSPDELRIVSKALRGTLKPGEEADAAAELQRKLLREKHRQLQQALREAQKAVDHIDAAERSEETER
jgi:hypothetical protein